MESVNAGAASGDDAVALIGLFDGRPGGMRSNDDVGMVGVR
jgi:hypothetical protein